MSDYNEIFNLKNDKERIQSFQQGSLSSLMRHGLRIDNGCLIGTPEWFMAIESSDVELKVLKGVLTRVYMGGHNDFPMFEMESEKGKSNWERLGIDEEYKEGRKIILEYVMQKLKNAEWVPITLRVLIQ